MKFPFFIAKRYLLTKKNKSIVNIISYISLLGVAIGTAALVIVLSVFNGFEGIVLDMYNSFDPHIKVSPTKGKTFFIKDVEDKLKEIKGIENYSFVLEEKVLIENNGNEQVVDVKAVDSNYSQLVNVDSVLKIGEYFDNDFYRNKNVLVLGSGVAYNLSVDIYNIYSQLVLTVPNKNSKYIKDRSDISHTVFTPLGIFSVQSEYDNKYALAPISRMQKMLEREGESSDLEICLSDPEKMQDIKNDLEQLLGEGFIVKTRLEQHDFLYKLLHSEKLAVFIILTFIMIIASFNIISSLSMLMIDKKDDIKTFWNLGSSKNQIRNIFFIKGFLGVLLGSCIGLVIGVLFSVLQQQFGFITMEGNFVVNNYPVKLDGIDVLIVEITVIIIGLIASYYPSKVLTDKFILN